MAWVLCCVLFLGCATSQTPAPEAGAPEASGDASTATLSLPEDAPARKLPTPTDEPALEWSDLTRIAREHQRRGEYAEAELRLEQASMLVADLPPTNARRRTVFGARARLAEVLAYQGEIAGADLLADELIDEAEREPELGDASLVSLALSVADRRIAAEQAAIEANQTIELHSQLRVLGVALTTAQTGTANRERLRLANRVSRVAYLEDELELARNAADQALADVRVLAPTARSQIANLTLLRAKIALEQGDAEQAIRDARRAGQISEEIGASPSRLGHCEAILAEALAASGDPEQGLDVARDARNRLDAAEPLAILSQRTILTALARIEASLGHVERARLYYDEALDLPAEDSDLDRHLASTILDERALLTVSGSTLPPEAADRPGAPTETELSAQPVPLPAD